MHIIDVTFYFPSRFSKSPLILVSLDGFRAEYLKVHSSHLPVVNKLRKSAPESAPPPFSWSFVWTDGGVTDEHSLCCRKGWNHDSTSEARLSHQDFPQPLHHRHCELYLNGSNEKCFITSHREDLRVWSLLQSQETMET